MEIPSFTYIRVLLFAILAFIFLPAPLRAQEKMLVHLKDGRTVEYDMTAVDYVELQTATPELDRTPASEVGGTVGEGVDLGLSVKWADQNLGASLPQESGTPLAWNADVVASSWGEGWRLPTEEEWQELYDKCSWRWVINSGVPGRLITAPNGNCIFLPASGVMLSEKNLLKGNCGIYWTADEDADSSVSAVGYYFDSANIYKMEYPMTNGLYIRPVKK